MTADNVEAASDMVLARRLGARRVWILHDNEQFGQSFALHARSAADRLGLTVSGFTEWHSQPSYDTLAALVASDRPGAVLLAGVVGAGGGTLAHALRQRLGPRPALIAAGLLPISLLIDEASQRVARTMYVSLPELPIERLPPAGQRFLERFRASQPPGEISPYAVYAAQATNIMLDAIARSNGTRNSVVHQLFATHINQGLLGSVSFDPSGDTTLAQTTILRPQHGGGNDAFNAYQGATIDRVITPSPNLSR